MSILINKDTKVVTQGITGKTGQFHTRMCRDYANGKAAFVAGVNPKKPAKTSKAFQFSPTSPKRKKKPAPTCRTSTCRQPAPPPRSGKPSKPRSTGPFASPKAFLCAT